MRMVVDLAVECDPHRAVLVAQRLVAAIDIRNGGASGADRHTRLRVGVHAFVVWAAMAQRRAHRPNRACVGIVRAPRDSTHRPNIDDRSSPSPHAPPRLPLDLMSGAET